MNLYEKSCGRFFISVSKEFNGGVATGIRLVYLYGAVNLKELTFPVEKEQAAIDIASHIYDAIEIYRECVIARMSGAESAT